MKVLNLSGGGTKIGAIFGAAETVILNKGYKPDIVSGISAGAILTVPIALGKFDELREIVTNFDLKTFFSNPPVNKKGKITFRALLNIFRKTYLGRQDNLLKRLSELVTEENFQDYKKGSYPICIIGTVDLATGKKFVYNCKELLYEEYLKLVLASASIPVFTPYVSFRLPYTNYHPNELFLVDGGVRNHILSNEVILNYPKINTCISIYSRAKDYRINKDYSPKNILDVLNRTIDIMNIQISKADEKLEKELCKNLQINLYQIFIPSVMKSVYDTDKVRLARSYTEGKFRASETLNNGGFKGSSGENQHNIF